jgi:hypothetical protein
MIKNRAVEGREMKKFRNMRRRLWEAQEKHAVLSFGRFQPPTIGHAKLIDKVKSIAAKVGGSHHVVLSHSQDSKKNPLSSTQKLKHARRFFPQTNLSVSSPKSPTYLTQAADLHKKGVTHLHMVAGSDRTEEFEKTLHKYNGTHKGALFNFKKITVHNAGERDPDAEGVEGMSASKMRAAAQSGNFDEFKKGIPSHVSDKHARELHDDVRKGMSINEENTLFEGVYDPSIFKAVFLAGGPGSGKDFILGKIISGFGLVEVSSDPFLTHLMTKHKLDLKMPEKEAPQRDIVRGRAKNLEQEKKRLVVAGRLGIVVNGVADEVNKILYKKRELEELGYETMMVFVNTSDEVSRQRNIERGQMGGRTVPETVRSEKWKGAQESRKQFAIMFGSDNFISVDNSEDLRYVDRETRARIEQGFLRMNKQIRAFVNTRPSRPEAQRWIQSELMSKKSRAVGNPLKEDLNSIYCMTEDSFLHNRGAAVVTRRNSYGGITRPIARTSDTATVGHQPAARAPDSSFHPHKQYQPQSRPTIMKQRRPITSNRLIKKEDWTTSNPVSVNWTSKRKDTEWTAPSEAIKADSFPRDFDTTMALTTPSGTPAVKGYLSPRLGEGERPASKGKNIKKILKEINRKKKRLMAEEEEKNLLENIDDLL